jgi:hypothetical protein
MRTKTTSRRSTLPQRRVRRGNPLLQEHVHDPYRSDVKQRTPVCCPQCGSTYRNGRWTWERLAASSPPVMCPACRRINDRYPAGEITLGGPFLAEHAGEAERMIDNIARAESREHPLNRVIDVKRTAEGLVVTTTDIHLPRRIGHAFEDAWGGKLVTHYDEEGHFARVRWER